MPLGKLGKYERVDVLGHGVSGIVYLAWDTLLKKQVALKEIDLQAADMSRFLEEARVMDRLNHPNIVHVNGVDKIDGHIVIDMEYVRGPNLQQLLRTEPVLALDRALKIAIQTLDGLDYAHKMRTVHRDIKPANILIGRGEEVKLVDFGLAEILATNSYAGGAGTYAYMAPEDFMEEHHSDHQSDIWAVGVTLYEMLTGARPFNVAKSKDPFAWRRALLSDPATPLAHHLDEVADGLQPAMDMALARDKQDRYQTAGQFRDDLIAIKHRIEPVYASRTAAVSALNGHSGASVPKLEAPVNAVGVLTAQSHGPSTVAIPLPVGPTTQIPNYPITKSPNYPTTQQPNNSTTQQPKGKGIFARKPARPATVNVHPAAVSLGEARKGEIRRARVTVRFRDGDGRHSATLAGAPPWVSVSPARFDRRNQTLTIVADSGRVWQTGEFEDKITFETNAGQVEIPVSIRVLPARPRFSEVAAWFVPLFAAALLPALTVSAMAHVADVRHIAPAAALGSALLAAMLLLVASAANLGTEERIACGVILAMMTVVLGMAVGSALHHGNMSSLAPLVGTGVPFGFMFLLQIPTRRHWKVWAGAIACLSLVAAYTIVSVINV